MDPSVDSALGKVCEIVKKARVIAEITEPIGGGGKKNQTIQCIVDTARDIECTATEMTGPPSRFRTNTEGRSVADADDRLDKIVQKAMNIAELAELAESVVSGKMGDQIMVTVASVARDIERTASELARTRPQFWKAHNSMGRPSYVDGTSGRVCEIAAQKARREMAEIAKPVRGDGKTKQPSQCIVDTAIEMTGPDSNFRVTAGRSSADVEDTVDKIVQKALNMTELAELTESIDVSGKTGGQNVEAVASVARDTEASEGSASELAATRPKYLRAHNILDRPDVDGTLDRVCEIVAQKARPEMAEIDKPVGGDGKIN